MSKVFEVSIFGARRLPPVRSGGRRLPLFGLGDGGGEYAATRFSSGASAGTGVTPYSTSGATQPAPPPTPCAYTYSGWTACGPDGTQTRLVTSQSPAGCVGVPVLSQPCTYVPPAPTQPAPTRPTGTTTPTPTQPSAPPACSYEYGPWSACGSDGKRYRSLLSSSPAGCAGTPDVLVDSCTYTPPATPPPTASTPSTSTPSTSTPTETTTAGQPAYDPGSGSGTGLYTTTTTTTETHEEVSTTATPPGTGATPTTPVVTAGSLPSGLNSWLLYSAIGTALWLAFKGEGKKKKGLSGLAKRRRSKRRRAR